MPDTPEMPLPPLPEAAAWLKESASGWLKEVSRHDDLAWPYFSSTQMHAYARARDAQWSERLAVAVKDAEAMRRGHDSVLKTLQRLAPDARRYQWLRTFDVDSYLANGRMEALDAAIDAAMGSQP